MHTRRFQFFFTIVFVMTGVAIGLIWALRELRHPAPIVAEPAPVDEKPFQTVDEALAGAPDADAEHMRQLLDAEEPIQQYPAPAALPPLPEQPTLAVALPPPPIPVGGESAAVVYDASVEAENMQRLVDSFAPLRDPAVSLDSPENRQAIQQMQANAAKRAMEAPKSLPKPQR